MTLDPERRASIHEKLVPILGEENTTAFLDAVDELNPTTAGTAPPRSTEPARHRRHR